MARDEPKSGDLRSALIEAAAQLIATEGAAGRALSGGAVAAWPRRIEHVRRPARDAADQAAECGALRHGVVSVRLARMLSGEEALRSLAGAIVSLFIAFGDEPQRARRSLARMAAAGAAA